jgi:hypothetical protein
VLAAVAGLTPLIGWLGPMGFALLVTVAGLLCLPALRITPDDRPLAIVLLTAVVWAAASTLWSPYRPADLEGQTALKLALQLPIYWAAWCGARRADPQLRRGVLVALACGCAAWGAIMLMEALTEGSMYQAIRNALHEPIQPDLARKNLAQSSFALALLWPVVAAGGVRAGAPRWLAIPMAAGAGLLANLFLSDAPVMAVVLAVAVGALVVVRPVGAPKAMGVAAALFVLLAPLAGLVARAAHENWQAPLSWSMRLGYWSHALDAILVQPFRGWGLDASRAIQGIVLHPHDLSLQLWLELGAPGAALGAIAWVLILWRLSRERPSLPAAGAAASAAVYLFFGAVSFGAWQEWWLALGALVAIVHALADGLPPRVARRAAPTPSTWAHPLR